MRILKILGLALAAGAILVVALLYALGSGWLGGGERAGEIRSGAVSPAIVGERARTQRSAARRAGVEAPSQILFGDLHVHTTFSFDAFLINLPMLGGSGAHPPADACDFARHCSALDFWSINDHAENIGSRLWGETLDSVRQCNAIAGDPENPDLVTYLGWEWSQIGTNKDDHYGHKNVVLLEYEEGRVPARPIGFRRDTDARIRPFARVVPTLLALANGERGRDFAYLLSEVRDTPRCPVGVPVRDLPADCRESALDPPELFGKLRDWGFPVLVIPHGTAWGMYTPAGSDWRKQIADHDPELERLIEVYSGHGSSEEYRPWRATQVAADGSLSCPPPGYGYVPSCWRAGELIGARCRELGERESECEAREARARQLYVEAYQGGWKTTPGYTGSDWLDAGQCRDCFQPAFNFRPLGSAQYIAAIRGVDERGAMRGFEMGFIGSSDSHAARPGTGYKEFWRGEMTEGRGADPDSRPPRFLIPRRGEPAAESVPFEVDVSSSPIGLFENERATGYFVTGGLVAVHASGRSREAIWDSLQRRRVYATSGPRILLWFDWLGDDGTASMGSRVYTGRTPRFRARAVGSFVQKQGCPDHSLEALGEERLELLCRGECYNPSDYRRAISRIEVIRIRPQTRPDEPVGPLIEDPWRVLPCDGDPAGCTVEFEDPEYAAGARDAAYYVRAVETESAAIHGRDPLNCSFDASGRCVAIEPCNALSPRDDDCLQSIEQRAWSSPIWLRFESDPPPS